MKTSRAYRFLKPTPLILLLFAFFLLCLWAGSIQAWIFSPREAGGIPKPPLFDAVRFFPFWPVLMITSFPLLFPAGIIEAAFNYRLQLADTAIFTIIWVIYYYLLACSLGFALRRLRQQ